MSEYIYYTYKTTHKNGKYYIGRHSTKNINDGYKGSGKWILSIKDRDSLTVEILEYYNSFEELKEAERVLIEEHIGLEKCMNFNNNPIGFASGELNPAKSAEERKRRSLRNKRLVEEGTHNFITTPNASTREDVKEMRRIQSKKELEAGTHNFLREDVRAKVVDAARVRWKENNPTSNPEVVRKQSEGKRNKAKRKIVQELKELKKKLKVKVPELGPGWYQKSDKDLERIKQNILEILKTEFVV